MSEWDGHIIPEDSFKRNRGYGDLKENPIPERHTHPASACVPLLCKRASTRVKSGNIVTVLADKVR